MRDYNFINLLTDEQRNTIILNFINLKNLRQLASIIDISYPLLTYYLYKIPQEKKYETFYIFKKSGGVREINAPTNSLCIIQRRLNDILQLIYKPRISTNGFVLGRNILTNSKRHIKKNNVVNIDLKDFFPSINFGRVRGLFLKEPFCLSNIVATTLAQLCCFNNALPQGAPTSPVISNFICRNLDKRLIEFAKNNRCSYTRYADDITFSTNKKELPDFFFEEIYKIIKEEGFTVNDKKVKIQNNIQRQEVTGLIVNEKVNIKRKYIRTIRAVLHDWEKNGYNVAREKYFKSYDRHRYNGVPDFSYSVRGRINFIGLIRGKNDIIYQYLKEKHKFYMQETTINNKFQKQLTWVKGMTDFINRELNKYVGMRKTNEARVMRDFIINKINKAINQILILEKSDNGAITTEDIYQSYWTCFNALAKEKIIKIDNDNENTIFKINDDFIDFEKNKDLFFLKKYFKIFSSNYPECISWIYLKYKFPGNDYIIRKYINDFSDLQANIKLFLIECGFNESVQLVFSLLNNKRNTLTLTHGTEEKISFRDCMLMLGFLSLLIRTNFLEKRDKVNGYFSKKIKNFNRAENNSLIVTGILNKKFEYKGNLFYLITYERSSSSYKRNVKCLIRTKSVYDRFELGKKLEIKYEIDANLMRDGNDYINYISTIEIQESKGKINSEFKMTGMLKKKYIYKNNMFFIILYKLGNLSLEKQVRCLIREKYYFENFSENDMLEIDYEIDAIPGHIENGYTNVVNIKRLRKLVENHC